MSSDFNAGMMKENLLSKKSKKKSLTIRSQVFDRTIGRHDPPVRIVAKARRIIDIHLDQILIKAIIAAVPASSGVHEQPTREIHIGAHEAGKGFVGYRHGVQKVRFGSLHQGAVRRVTGQVGQTLPFEAKSPYNGEPTGRASVGGFVGEVQVVGWYTGRGIECETQTVRKAFRLREESVDGRGVGSERRQRALEKVIC